MEKQIFVAREHELAQLGGFLGKALASKGLVCFVTGEAGSGKTTLVMEFANRIQQQHADLAVAVGQSDAQTGAGDAHLPFREVIGQLTGDVESKVAKGAITKENAKRLQQLLNVSGQVLLDVGPDLIDIFVPGAKLAARAGALVAQKAGWLDRLEKFTKKPAAGLKAETIEQGQIYEQYANVLCKLSDKQPLLLVLDDLQWADTASIELLFHLARRIEGHRIMIVCTYRPEEVAIGRVGDRHPLEKVLAELKRYYGDIWVDLNHAQEAEGRQFVNAIINTEPNQLGAGFRQKLYQHTCGHPLFTIELLRNMQEREQLVLDEQGQWVETPALDWNSLPTRVEGVVEERIGRLEHELRQMLTVGSVEGEDFTAEVVARVQNIDVRGLVSKLGAELERHHRLVKSQGVRRLDLTGQRLSQYQFQHSLFQKYLYNELDEAERAYLHEDIGNALEEFYGDQVDEIAVQLARHFSEAGVTEKARVYLEKAGNQAAERFANDEALIYLNRALELTPKNKSGERFNLTLSRERIYGLQGRRDLQSKDLETLVELVRVLNNNKKRCEVALRQAAYGFAICDYPASIASAQGAAHLSELAQDTRSRAQSHFEWGRSASFHGEYETALVQLEKSLSISKSAGLQDLEAMCLLNLGNVYTFQTDYPKASSYYEESLSICREVGDQQCECKAIGNLASVCHYQGDLAKSREFTEQALEISTRVGDRRQEGIQQGNLGNISLDQGSLIDAKSYFEKSLQIFQEIGDRGSECVIANNIAGVSIQLGDIDAGTQMLEKQLQVAREIGGQVQETYLLLGLSDALTLQGKYSTALEVCEQSMQKATELGDQWCVAHTHNTLGQIFDCVGSYLAAREHLETGLNIARSMELRTLESDSSKYLSLLFHHMGENQTALRYSQEALEIAKHTGIQLPVPWSLFHQGQALESLLQLEDAANTYEHCLQLWREMSQHHLSMEPLAGLARIKLVQGKNKEAQELVEEILRFLNNHTLDGLDEPLQVYLTCARVLKANHDSRSKDVMNSAYELLKERADDIKDEEMRNSYLDNVAVNREIIEAWKMQKVP